MNYIVYKFENKVNGKCYIGVTKNKLSQRVGQHKSKAKTGSKVAFSCAIRKYGIENFDISIIDSDISKDEISEKEKFYIRKYNSVSPNGYNRTLGGDGTLGHEVSEKERKDRSKRFKGVPKTDEHRKAISNANKGVPKIRTERVIEAHKRRKGTKQNKILAEQSRAFLNKALKKWTGSKHSEKSKRAMRKAKSRAIIIKWIDRSVKLNTTLGSISSWSGVAKSSLSRSALLGTEIKKNCILKGATIIYGN